MEPGVLDMPAGPDDPERRLTTDLARTLADDGKAPGGWFLLVRLGHHGADRADSSLVGIQCLDIVDVPEIHLFFPLRIVAALAPPLDLPELECFFERFVLFLLENQEAAVTVIGELGHHRPVGVEGIADEGIDEPAVRSEEHTSELQSRLHLVCRLLLENNTSVNRIFA